MTKEKELRNEVHKIKKEEKIPHFPWSFGCPINPFHPFFFKPLYHCGKVFCPLRWLTCMLQWIIAGTWCLDLWPCVHRSLRSLPWDDSLRRWGTEAWGSWCVSKEMVLKEGALVLTSLSLDKFGVDWGSLFARCSTCSSFSSSSLFSNISSLPNVVVAWHAHDKNC